MNCNHSKTYRSRYKAYTNGHNKAGYGSDIFEKNCYNKPENSCKLGGECSKDNDCCSNECIKINDMIGECVSLQPQNYNFNTLNETTYNMLYILGRPALTSCKDGSVNKDGKIYCPSSDEYTDSENCPMYKQCDCTNSNNCEECVKTQCMKNYDCTALCLSRAGKLPVLDKNSNVMSACKSCES